MVLHTQYSRLLLPEALLLMNMFCCHVLLPWRWDTCTEVYIIIQATMGYVLLFTKMKCCHGDGSGGRHLCNSIRTTVNNVYVCRFLTVIIA